MYIHSRIIITWLSHDRSMQEIQLDKHIKLLDSPGLIMMGGAADDPVVALRNCVKVTGSVINE